MSQDAAAQRRARQTVTNLVLALGASAGLVLALVLMVPRDDSNLVKHVDYVAIATDAADATGRPIVVPKLDQGWWSNSARLTTSPKDGTEASWYAGFVGPKNEYIGLTQAFGTNPTWLALQLNGLTPTGTKTIVGRTWAVWESPVKNDPPKTRDYTLVAELGNDTVLVYGTASPADFEKFAQNVGEQIRSLYP
jgi:Protein of unknown function (DUF4245)